MSGIWRKPFWHPARLICRKAKMEVEMRAQFKISLIIGMALVLFLSGRCWAMERPAAGRDPGKFKAAIKEKREKVRKQLRELKKNDPERYHQVMQKIRQRRLARLERLRKENPGKFKEIMQRRRAAFNERLENLKTEDPERYQRVIQHRQKIQEVLRLQQENPEKYREFLEQHPGWLERLERRRGADNGS